MDDWKPIDTAPKDRQIIVCGPYSDDVAIVQWNGVLWRCMSDGYDVIESEGDFGTEYRHFQIPHWWMECPKKKA